MTNETVRMIELAGQGFYCSQILLLMGLETQGRSDPDLIRAMSGLAGGMGFSGDVCGALTGGACLLGLYAGRGTFHEEEDPRLNLMVTELVEWFSEQFGEMYGGIHCSVILDDDPRNRTARCPGLVVGVYEKVKGLLVENGFDLTQVRS
ncbi:MAG: DVU_1555 family C-GCAxxG-C-C protein [Syntrophobacteraceae bacterium]